MKHLTIGLLLIITILLVSTSCSNSTKTSANTMKKIDFSDGGLEEFRRARQQYQMRQKAVEDYNTFSRSLNIAY